MNAKNIDVLCGYYDMSPDDEHDRIVAYHITAASNVDGIRQDGLIAKSCVAQKYGNERPAAVYLFALKCDTIDRNVRGFLFEAGTDVAVIKVSIEAKDYGKIADDMLFNISCICEDETLPTAFRFLGDIPAENIEIL